jgi:hypothetical protein
VTLEQINRQGCVSTVAMAEPLPTTGLLAARVLVQIRLQQLGSGIDASALGEFSNVVNQSRECDPT